MRKTVTSELCRELNKVRGIASGDKGSVTYADYRGDGTDGRRVYEYTNREGGQSISLSPYHHHNPKVRCQRLRAAIAAAKK